MICKLKKFFVIALALMSVIALSILPASAVTDDNKSSVKSYVDSLDFIQNNEDNKNYICVYLRYDGDFYQYYLYLYDDVINPVLYENLYQIHLDASSFSYYYLKTKDFSSFELSKCNTFSDVWVTCYDPSNSYNYTITSSYDLINPEDNTVFFSPVPPVPPTLLDQLLSLVPQVVGEKITTDLATLTICGVACLALLICLSLLPKVLYKFL